MVGADTNAAMLAYLRTRYTVVNGDLTTLVQRYLVENPLARSELTARMQGLIAAAQAA